MKKSSFAQIVELYNQVLEEWTPVFNSRWSHYKYVAGDQWDKAVEDKLDRENRPHLTINMIFGQVLTAFGSQKLNRNGVSCYPLRGNDKDKAAAMKKLLMYYEQLNDTPHSFGVAMADAIIGGFGSVSLTFGDDKDVEGSVEIKADDPFTTLLDPNSTEPDLSDCRFAFRHHWMSIDELLTNFPDKKKKIKEAAGQFKEKKNTWWEKGVKLVKGIFTKLTGSKQLTIFELYDQADDLYKVLYFYEKQSVLSSFLYDQMTGDYFEPPKDKKELQYLMSINPNLKVISKKKDVLMLTVVCPVLGLTLADTHKYKIQSKNGGFPFVCFWGYDFLHTKTEVFGVPKNLIGLQDDYNKRESQILHIINTTANSGWYLSKGSGVDPQWLREHGSKNGIVIEHNDGRKPEKIQPNQYSSNLMMTTDKRPDQMQMVSGINPNMAGFHQTREETGTLFRQRVEAGRGLLEHLFSNNQRSLKQAWQYAADVAAQCETTEKIFNVVSENGEVEINGINVMQPDGSIINDIRKANIGIKIESGDNTPTARLAKFMQKIELTRMMPPELVYWPWILKDSDLTDVDEQIEYIHKIMGMQAEQQQEEMAGQNVNQLLQMRGLINDQQQKQVMTARALRDSNENMGKN